MLLKPTPALAWSCLLGAFLALGSLALLRPPQLVGCVFRQRANITCHWEHGDRRPGDRRPPVATNYTLRIEKMRRGYNGSLTVITAFTCTTTRASCTVPIYNSSVAFTFCIDVTAHGPAGVTQSAPRCQSGRREVMLAPVRLTAAEAVNSRPRCLKLSWERPESYAVSEPEVKGGNLTSQIEYSAEGKPGGRVGDVKVMGSSFTACLFRANTRYSVRLRHRFLSEASPWSQWSNQGYASTVEDAPSVAPAFWRQVKQTHQYAWRHVVLLWKPLHYSLARGEVLRYNVMCHSGNTRLRVKNSSCGVLPHTRTSCDLLLPPGGYSCFLTASNSAGTSPVARLDLLGSTDTEQPPPRQVTVSPLDDSRLDVRWMAPDGQSPSGFVVEWSAVSREKSSVLHWERLNASHRARVIAVNSEGVEPMVCYAVTVSALYGEQGTGKSRILHVYTRQGAPSAGPKVKVQSIFGNSVELKWSPLPVEQQRGYIRNYTIHYTHAHGHTGRVCVPGNVYQYSLTNLSPGNYDLYMQANTDAGTGVAGAPSNVNIGPPEVSLTTALVKGGVLTLVLTSLVLMLVACLSRTEIGRDSNPKKPPCRVKQKLCQDIPDPSKSSLAHWTPQSHVKNNYPHMEMPDVLYSEITSVDEGGLGDAGVVQVLSYHTVHFPPTYSSEPYTSLLCPGAEAPQTSTGAEKEGPGSPSSAKDKRPAKNLPVSDYSQIVIALPDIRQKLQPHSSPQFTDSLRAPDRCSDGVLPLEGDRETLVSLPLPRPPPDEWEISPLRKEPPLLPSSLPSDTPTRRSSAVSGSRIPSIFVLDPIGGPISLSSSSFVLAPLLDDEPYILSPLD